MASGMLSVIKVIQTNGTLTGGGVNNVIDLARPNGAATTEIYRDVNLLAAKPELGLHYLPGRANIALGATWAVVGVVVKKLEKKLADNTYYVIYYDATGIAGNAALLTNLLNVQPLDSGESFRITLNKAAGGALAGSVLTRYDLGVSEDRATATPTL